MIKKVAIIILLIFSLMGWLLGSNLGVAFLFGRLEGFGIELGNVAGNLFDGLRVDRISYEDDSLKLEIRDFGLEFSKLLSRKVLVQNLSFGSIEIEKSDDQEPLDIESILENLEHRLRLVLLNGFISSVEVRDLVIELLLIKIGNSPEIRFSDLRANLHLDQEEYRLNSLQANSDILKIKNLELAFNPVYPFKSSVSLDSVAADYSLKANLNGDLNLLSMSADLQNGKIKLNGKIDFGKSVSDLTQIMSKTSLDFRGKLENINLLSIHPEAPDINISGQIEMKGDLKNQNLTLNLQDFKTDLNIDGKILISDLNKIKLNDLKLTGGGSEFVGSGDMNLRDGDFDLFLKFRSFDVVDFVKLFGIDESLLNMSVDWFFGGGLDFRVSDLISDSIFDSGSLEMRGWGEIIRSGDSIFVPWFDSEMRLLSDVVRVYGAYGLRDDVFNVEVELSDLGRIVSGLGGSINFDLRSEGLIDDLRVEYGMVVDGFRFRGISAELLSFRGDIFADLLSDFGGRGLLETLRLSSVLRARGIRFSEVEIREAEVKLGGTALGHEIDVLAVGVAGDYPFDFGVSVRGGFESDWSGEIVRFEDAEFGIKLTRAVRFSLLFGSMDFRTSDMELLHRDMLVRLDGISFRDQKFSSSGGIRNIRFSKYFGVDQIEEDLVFDLGWRLDFDILRGIVDSDIEIRRSSGDVRVNDVKLGIDSLFMNITTDADSVVSRLNVRSGLGDFEVYLRVFSNKGILSAERLGDLSLEGVIISDVRVGSLIDPFLPSDVNLDAGLDGRLEIFGSLSSPEFRGRLKVNQLGLAVISQGIYLKEGEVQIDFFKDKLIIRRAEIFDYDLKSKLTLNGEISLLKPELLASDNPLGAVRAALNISASGFKVIDRPGRKVQISLNNRVLVEDGVVKVIGGVDIDRAKIEIVENGTPALSSDVVILNSESVVEKKRKPLPLSLDVDVNLGDGSQDRIYLSAFGLDTYANGRLKVTKSVGSEIRVFGELSLNRGRVNTYGQSFVIQDRSYIRFAGDPSNFGLNVRATRPNLAVDAGVLVSGPLSKLKIQLYSNPGMSETEILSWLILGHGLEVADVRDDTSANLASLLLAAGDILNKKDSVPIQRKIARIVGFDELAILLTESRTQILSLSKNINDRLSFSFRNSLDNTQRVLSLTYYLREKGKISVEFGKQTAVELLLHWAF